jgi:hypothetical protein
MAVSGPSSGPSSGPNCGAISGEASGASVNRRGALGSAAIGSAATAAWALLAAAGTVATPLAANAVGPVNMELTGVTYEAAECPAALKAGRIGGAFGGAASKEVTQQCVKVSATALNPTKAALKECAVFGFVLDEQVGPRRASLPPLKETQPVYEISVQISVACFQPPPLCLSIPLNVRTTRTHTVSLFCFLLYYSPRGRPARR